MKELKLNKNFHKRYSESERERERERGSLLFHVLAENIAALINVKLLPKCEPDGLNSRGNAQLYIYEIVRMNVYRSKGDRVFFSMELTPERTEFASLGANSFL